MLLQSALPAHGPLDLLQSFHISFRLGTPGLDAVLQVRSQWRRAEEHNPLPWAAGAAVASQGLSIPYPLDCQNRHSGWAPCPRAASGLSAQQLLWQQQGPSTGRGKSSLGAIPGSYETEHCVRDVLQEEKGRLEASGKFTICATGLWNSVCLLSLVPCSEQQDCCPRQLRTGDPAAQES